MARACIAAFAWLVVASPRFVLANDRTDFLIDRLKSDDLRVRTSAALQLGKTNDDAAVQPLCGALSDPERIVRIAAASALKPLGRASAAACLNARIAVEPDGGARAQMQATLAALPSGGGGGSSSPATVANAKYYVALSRVTNNTGRPQADVENVVLGAIRAKLAALGNAQLAPPGESPAAARSVISSRHLKGYYFSIMVDAFDYSGGNLRVKVKLAIFSYPGKDLRGEVPVSPVQSGVSPGDTASENNLMDMAAAHAVELFAQSFP